MLILLLTIKRQFCLYVSFFSKRGRSLMVCIGPVGNELNGSLCMCWTTLDVYWNNKCKGVSLETRCSWLAFCEAFCSCQEFDRWFYWASRATASAFVAGRVPVMTYLPEADDVPCGNWGGACNREGCLLRYSCFTFVIWWFYLLAASYVFFNSYARIVWFWWLVRAEIMLVSR